MFETSPYSNKGDFCIKFVLKPDINLLLGLIDSGKITIMIDSCKVFTIYG